MNTRGFTLVEVLVAASIMTITSILVLKSVSSLLEAYDTQTKFQEMDSGVEQIFAVLQRDLEATLLLNNGKGWLQVHQSETDWVTNTSLLAFTAKDTAGLPVAIVYDMRPEEVSFGKTQLSTWRLYRLQLDPLLSLQDYIHTDSSDVVHIGQMDYWLNAELLSGSASSRTLLTSQIVHFKVSVYTNSADGDLQLNTEPSYSTINTLLRPAYCIVEIILITETGLNLLHLDNFTTSEILESHTHKYIRRIDFSAGSP